MGSVTVPSKDDLYRQLALISLFRAQGLGEDEVAEQAKYRGAGHMRQELEKWGLPTWFVEGDSPPEPKSHPSNDMQDDTNDSKTRTSGPVEELPPTRNAIPLFQKVLDGLARENEKLKYRRESRQGKHYPYRIFSSRPVSDDERDFIVERLGLGEVDRGFMYFDGAEVTYRTSSRAPLSPLPELIGTYLLAGGDVEKLVKALHPPHREPNWPEITRWIEGVETPGRKLDGIKSIALRLAILVRGGTNAPGKPPPVESGHYLKLSHRITTGLEEGVPAKELYEELLVKYGLSEEEFPWSEFRRLADLGLRLP